MWTPKRIIMLSGCFLAFFIAYLSYTCTALGRMDGLPPLPEPYWPNPTDDGVPPQIRSGETQLSRKIKQAFGPKCKELNRPIRLDMAAKGMVLCAEQFELKEGKVSLFEPSLALFGKDKKDGLPVEINTISGKTALLTFDRPVHNFSEIGNHKLTKAEIQGEIEIRNNRRRVERDQDLHVSIRLGPLSYDEPTHKVWTEDNVRVEDHKSKPEPHVIIGKGMELELQIESVHDPKHPEHKPVKESITGVKWIELKSGVVMKLYSEGKGGLFAGNGPGQPPKAPAKKPAGTGSTAPTAKAENPPTPDRYRIDISTPGWFRYEINKGHDLAIFHHLPKSESGRARTSPAHIDVLRTNLTSGQKLADHLVCQDLELRMHRKESKPGEKPAPAENKEDGEGAEIESIHATGSQGTVVLTSDAEKLDATCSDLYHNAIKGLTILKDGREVVVHKEDNDIYARELQIQDVKPPQVPGQPEPKPYQNVNAKGPGHIRTVSKDQPPAGTSAAAKPDAPKTPPRVQHAEWKDLLTFSKDNGLDLLVLNGKARFIDEQAEQSVAADVIKVWLDEAGPPQEPGRGKVRPMPATSAVPRIAEGRQGHRRQGQGPGIRAGNDGRS